MPSGTVRRHIASLLLVLWGLMGLSTVVFRHAHRLPDGRIVTHVHPYLGLDSTCSFPNHQHSETELLWLDCIGNVLFDVPVLGVPCPLPTIWLSRQDGYAFAETQQSHRFFLRFLRGPPSLLAA